MADVIPTDRHKSVLNLCEMKDHGGVLVLSFGVFFFIFLVVRAFVVGLSQIFFFFSLVNIDGFLCQVLCAFLLYFKNLWHDVWHYNKIFMYQSIHLPLFTDEVVVVPTIAVVPFEAIILVHIQTVLPQSAQGVWLSWLPWGEDSPIQYLLTRGYPLPLPLH